MRPLTKLLNKLYLSQYFLLFVFLFAYLHSIQQRISATRAIDFYTFTPEAGLFNFFSACLIFLFLGMLLQQGRTRVHTLQLKHTVVVFFTALLSYLIITTLISFLISLSFGTIERNFTHNLFIKSTLSSALDFCIFGGFYLAHYFYWHNKADNEQLAAYNKALAESKIAQLKSQLNPHFLFNNLNVLDQLIEEDLYRYVLQTSDKKLVPVTEELYFAQRYFKLMAHKYGNAYELKISGNKQTSGFIPPLTLQLLVENAIEHNLGTEQAPVRINLHFNSKLTVANNIAARRKHKTTGGRALENLREQYALLSNDTVEIMHTPTHFEVTLPVITERGT
jgi:sensor histidine kinase YesM